MKPTRPHAAAASPPRDATATGLRVGIDATPLLGARTGIGKYVEHLTQSLVGRPPLAELRATAFSWRGQEELRQSVPSGVSVAARRAPARGLQELWARQEFPPVELLTGSIDVFHGTNFVLPPLRRAAGVVTIHDLAYLRLPQTVHAASLRYRELVPKSLQRAALVLTPSHAVGVDVIDAYQLPADRVMVTPLGVHRRWFGVTPPDVAWLRERGLPPEYLLAVGTLEPRKGLDVLITAYRMLLAEEPDVPPLVLVGSSGWGERPDITTVPPGRVVLPGYLSDEELTRVVAGARLLAFPSRYEGFGLPPLEAMAAGVPVVASDLPAVREATGGFVRLAAPDDPGALAAALATELHDVPEAGRTAAAREHAAHQTWQRCAELTLRAYELAVQ